MRVLLTGASGFLGSHALRHIMVNTDWDVVCPVTFRHKGVPRRLQSAMAGQDHHRVTIVRCDLAAPIDRVTAHDFGRPDYIINYASQSHVDRSITDPNPFVSNNIQVILNLLDYARTLTEHLYAFVHVSTDEVYGPAPIGHNHTEWETYLPSNPYSASKAAQESIAFSYWRTYGVPVVITNCMNLFGEMQDQEKYVPTIMRHLAVGTPVNVHVQFDDGDGHIVMGSRYYLHARNLADAILFILRQPEPVSAFRHVSGGRYADRPDKYHVVGEREVNNLELAQFIAKQMGKELDYNILDFYSARPGHDIRYALDGSKLERLGWQRPFALEDSLRRTVDWTLMHPEWL